MNRREARPCWHTHHGDRPQAPPAPTFSPTEPQPTLRTLLLGHSRPPLVVTLVLSHLLLTELLLLRPPPNVLPHTCVRGWMLDRRCHRDLTATVSLLAPPQQAPASAARPNTTAEQAPLLAPPHACTSLQGLSTSFSHFLPRCWLAVTVHRHPSRDRAASGEGDTSAGGLTLTRLLSSFPSL